MTSESKPSSPNSVLIMGFGDIGTRVANRLKGRCAVSALVRRPERAEVAEACGAVPLQADLVDVSALQKVMMPVDVVIHLAPPSSANGANAPPHGVDLGTENLIRALTAVGPPRNLVYVSTTGVYGDAGGGWVDEATPLNPQSARARRRVAAEHALAEWAARNGVVLTVLRAPGIYAAERLPLPRLLSGTPAIHAAEDSFSNHIHADDLAAACVAAITAKQSGTFNVVDDSALRMGDYFDLVADRFGLLHPPRVARNEAEALVGPAMWSFMRESRRIRNQNMKLESGLNLTLRWPTVQDFLCALPDEDVAAILANARAETRLR